MEQPEKSVVEGKEQGEEEKGIAARLVPAEERKLQDVYVLGCYGVTMVLTLAMGFAAVASAKDLGTLQQELVDCNTDLQSNRLLQEVPEVNEFDTSTGFATLAASPAACAVSVLCALLLGALWMYLLKEYTRMMVWGTIGFTLAVQVALAIWLLAAGSAVGGVIILIATALYALFIYFIRDSINLSADVLQLGVTALKDYPSQLLVNTLILIVTLVLFAGLIVFQICAALSVEVQQIKTDSGVTICAAVTPGWATFYQYLAGFTLLWTLMTGMQVAQYSAAFMAGEWYFNPPERRCKSPSWTGLRLGITLAAGTNMAAGLVLAIIEMMRDSVRRARQQGGICMAVMACFIRFILNILEFMTNFATIMAAVSGEGFIDAAKHGANVLKHSFVDGYITDRISKRVLYIGAVMLGLLSGTIAWALLDSATGYNSISTQGGWFILVAIMALLGPFGVLLGAIVGSIVQGQVGVVVMAGFLGAVASTAALFLAESLIDLTSAMFAFWAIDKYCSVTSYGSSPAMVGAMEGFAAGTGQLKDGQKSGSTAAAPKEQDQQQKQSEPAFMVHLKSMASTGRAKWGGRGSKRTP